MSTSSPPSNDASSSMVRKPPESTAQSSALRPWRSRDAPSGPGDGAATVSPPSLSAPTVSPPPNRRTNSDNSLSRSPPQLSGRDSILAATFSIQDGSEVPGAAAAIAGHEQFLRRTDPLTLGQPAIAPSASTDGRDSSPASNVTRRSTFADLFSTPIAQEVTPNVRFESLSHGPHRNDSDLLKRVKNLEKRQHITKTGLSDRLPVAYPLRMSNQWWDEGSQLSIRDDEKRDPLAASSNNSADVRPSLGRTQSKSHGKHRIEAKLAKDEPVANARSRKASHYLGLFKENTAAQDPRKQSEKVGKEPVLPRDRWPKPRSPTSSIVEEPFPPITAEKQASRAQRSTESESKQASAEFIEGRQNENLVETDSPVTPRLSAIADKRSQGLVQSRPSPEHDSIEWRSSTPSGGSLPLRLLEEIRSRPKLESSVRSQRESRGKHEHELPLDSQLDSDQITPRVQLSSIAIRRSSQPKDINEEDDDAEYESDKEHISSATYFPHQAPSPEGSDEGQESDQVPKLDLDDEQLIPQTIALDAVVNEILPESQHSAKALQSKGTVRSIQQTIERAGPQAILKESIHATTNISGSDWSKSDTENDSTDDTLISDNERVQVAGMKGDVTPTATASSGAEQFGPRMRRAPLGAVELRPYKHQVGGHTKVFSFSRQAICKQLNNRENEFYEVVERNHPDLLKFLPRYLGVLNVTYQKAPRRKKKADSAVVDQTPKSQGQAAKESATLSPSKPVEGHFPDSSSTSHSHPMTRAISHSHHFDAQDDAIPQVIYANNMHMIPTNLFPVSPPHSTKPSEVTPVADPQSPSKQTDFFSLPRGSRSAWPQSPTWGATTVNTQFKDTVLREVFSPPIVHQRKRRGYTRREHGHHLRGHSHLPQLAYPESVETPLARSVTPDIASSRGPLQSAFPPPPRMLNEAADPLTDRATGHKPHSQLTEASLASLDNKSVIKSESSETSHADTRVIGRRRSGGNLRRGQIDIDNNKRSAFKYYEDEDAIADSDGEPAFAKEARGSRAPSTTSSYVTDRHSLHDREIKPIKLQTDAPTSSLEPPISLEATPMNPVQAQQQRDKHVRHFLLLEDLTANMSRPCVLDLKMGTRQYGIEATKKKQASQRQKCKTTTSQKLGVRVCGMQVWNAYHAEYVFEDKYAGRDVKPGRDFQNALTRFLYDGESDASITRHIPPLLEKLSKLETMILNLPGYRFYASSLLMLYDGAYGPSVAHMNGHSSHSRSNSGRSTQAARETSTGLRSGIEVRLVDFANCVTAEDKLPENTPCPPHDRYGVDRGYIRGLRSLRTYLQRIWKEIEESEWVERGEADGMGLGRKGAGSGVGMSQPDNWKETQDDLGEVSM